jgi:hypothetical protein
VRSHRRCRDHGPVPNLAYKAAAEYFTGVPLLDGITRPDFNTRVLTLWLPALGEPGHYTERGRRFDSVVKYLFGGDLPLRLQGLRQRYVPNMLAEGPVRGPLGRAASTLGIRYHIDPGLGVNEDELNRDIRRFAPAPGARARATGPVFAELTGRITVPVLAIHETGDARVPFSLQQAYRRRTLAAGTAHCSCNVPCAGAGTARSTVRSGSKRSTTSLPGSSAASSRTGTTCWRPTCRSWGCDGHLSSTPTIRRDAVEPGK